MKKSKQVLTRGEWARGEDGADRGEYPSLWAAIKSIAPKIRCVPQMLHEWVKRVKVDRGAGVTTSEAQRVKDLERNDPGPIPRTARSWKLKLYGDVRCEIVLSLQMDPLT